MSRIVTTIEVRCDGNDCDKGYTVHPPDIDSLLEGWYHLKSYYKGENEEYDFCSPSCLVGYWKGVMR